jgi:hypothetical protein
MAATLLSQLESAISAVQREAASHDGVLTDSSEYLSDVCLLLERVFNFSSKNRTSVLGDKRDYWAFIQTALEKSSAFVIVKKIQSSSDNKTSIGKARSFIRTCLVSKSLGSVIQVLLLP